MLTRDRELLKRRAVTHACYVHALKSEQQLREIVERLDLARSARPFTLCLHCNVPLHPIDKASVFDRLPPKVQANYERFSTCDSCGRVFWEGSHWRNMRRVLDGIVSADEQCVRFDAQTLMRPVRGLRSFACGERPIPATMRAQQARSSAG